MNATGPSASRIKPRQPTEQFAFAQKLALIFIRAEILAEVAAGAVGHGVEQQMMHPHAIAQLDELFEIVLA